MSEHDLEFTGGAFHPALADGRAGVRITLLSDRIQVACEGGKTFALPYEGMRIEIGGASGKMAFLRGKVDQLTVYSEEPGFLAAMRRESGGRLDEAIDALIGARTTRRASGAGWLVAALVAAVLVGWGAWIAMGLAFDAAIGSTPITIDRQLGDLAEKNAEPGQKLDDPVVTAAIVAMVDRLKPTVAVNGLEWRVQVQRNDQLNAFALPGGSITVLSGLIAKAETPEQVAGVLAHEMAHATKRHGLRQVARSLGVVAVAQVVFGDATGVIAIAAQGATIALLTGYSREMEREADAEGARMMAAAGLDPRGLIAFFKIMQQEPNSQAPEMLQWMSSHPATQERIDAMERLIPTLPRGEAKPLALDWPAVRAAAGHKPKAVVPAAGSATAAPTGPAAAP